MEGNLFFLSNESLLIQTMIINSAFNHNGFAFKSCRRVEPGLPRLLNYPLFTVVWPIWFFTLQKGIKSFR